MEVQAQSKLDRIIDACPHGKAGVARIFEFKGVAYAYSAKTRFQSGLRLCAAGPAASTLAMTGCAPGINAIASIEQYWTMRGGDDLGRV
jgi:hypothetical protein